MISCNGSDQSMQKHIRSTPQVASLDADHDPEAIYPLSLTSYMPSLRLSLALQKSTRDLLHYKRMTDLHENSFVLWSIPVSNAGSYGSTKRYKSIQRVQKVNDSTIIGASGELSDFQYLLNQLEQVATDEFCMDDGLTRGPKEYFSWLTQVLYARRNK